MSAPRAFELGVVISRRENAKCAVGEREAPIWSDAAGFKTGCVGIASASDLRDDSALVSWCRGDGGANAHRGAGDECGLPAESAHVSAQLS